MRDAVVKVKGKRHKVKFGAAFRFVFLPFTFCLFTFAASSQRVAILAPDNSDDSREAASKLENSLAKQLSILDDSMARTAFDATAPPERPFNLSKEEARRIGAAIGSDFFVLLHATDLRRSSSTKPVYFEASAAIFVVSARSGRLVRWQLLRFEAEKPDKAGKMLAASIDAFARTLAGDLKEIARSELAEPAPPVMEEPPDDGTPAAKNFRAPVPYRRIKPQYTTDAFLYDIAATIDMFIDLDANGAILRTEIVRWAGYGLDESVEKAVRSMNWRPAERNGKPLPMRFLVRYNFRKFEKQEDN